jgi:hypothetical protein
MLWEVWEEIARQKEQEMKWRDERFGLKEERLFGMMYNMIWE